MKNWVDGAYFLSLCQQVAVAVLLRDHITHASYMHICVNVKLIKCMHCTKARFALPWRDSGRRQ